MIALLAAIALALANLNPAFAQEPFTIRIDGPAEAARLSQSAVQAFEVAAPGRVRVVVDGNGNDAAIHRFCRGEAQLAAASRALSETEDAECRRAGVEFAEMPIARGLRLYVSAGVLARPEGVEFVRYYAANAPELARRAGLAPAPRGADAEALARSARGRGDSEASPALAQLLDVLRALATRPPEPARGADGALEARPSEIGEGGQTTLRWRSTNAVSGVIDNGVGEVNPIARGSIVVTPQATTDYVLTLIGRDGRPVVRQARVMVWPRPDGALSADPPEIAEGGETTLRWTSTDAISGAIDNGVGAANPIENGSLVVRPQATTNYTLTLVGRANQQVTRPARVAIAPPPDGALSADAPEVAEGGETTLRWTSTNAVSGVIDNGVGAANPVESGSLVVSPQATTDYTLTLSGRANQQVTRPARVTVAPAPDGRLSADAIEIAEGGETTLRWTSTNAVSGVIDNGVGAANPIENGSQVVTPRVTTDYTLTLSGRANQQVTRQARVTVAPAPDGRLSADATEVAEGGEATLRWTSTNAVSGVIDNGVGAANPVEGGSLVVRPQATTTYTLRLEGRAGQSVVRRMTIRVVPPPTGALWADPREIETKGAEVTLHWTATNAVRGSIDNGGGAVIPIERGQVTVTPQATTTYTLTLFNSVGQSFTTPTTVRLKQNWLPLIGALIAVAIAAMIFLRPQPPEAPDPDPHQPEKPEPRITTRIVSDGRAGETLAIDEPTGFERELRFAVRAESAPEIAIVPDGSDIGSEP